MKDKSIIQLIRFASLDSKMYSTIEKGRDKPVICPLPFSIPFDGTADGNTHYVIYSLPSLSYLSLLNV